MDRSKEIKNKRKAIGFSASKFAKYIGVSLCSVYHWENGLSSPRYKIVDDRINALFSVCSSLKRDPNYLIKLLKKG